MAFYDYEAVNVKGETVKMDTYKGKVVLVVNSATRCGFTPQYDDLEALYEKYGNQGFQILEFPCNQFGEQAPESDAEIATICTVKFGLKFDRFKKVDVNGENALPLFKFLQSQIGFQGFDPAHQYSALLEKKFSEADPNFKEDPSIKWNFTKFLIDCEGNVVARFEPTTDIAVVEETVQKYL